MFGAIGFNQQDIVKDGLILWLDANDKTSYPGVGTTWRNLARGGNNGTLTNGPTFNSGNGGHFIFDGSDDYVNCGIISSLPSGIQNRTMMGWVQDNTISDYTVFGSIMGYGDNNAGAGRLFMFMVGGSGFNNRRLLIWGNSDNYVSSFSLDRNIWTHICVTVTTGVTYPRITIFKNGISDGGSELNINTTNTEPFQIADYTQAGGYDNNLLGKVALVQVYNRALSQNEITQNYNATKARFGL
jgi:hypothetical protein